MPGRSHLALFGRTSGLSAKVEGMSHGLPVTRDSLRYVTLDNLYEGQTLLEYQVMQSQQHVLGQEIQRARKAKIAI